VVDIGESWAYRARSVDHLVEVEVLRIGTTKPARVLVRFVADEFEGLQDWVPPARFKVLWSGVDEFMACEARWAAVIEASAIRDTAEDYAASTVFDALIDNSFATIGYNACAGVTTIHDVDGLAGFLELDPGQLRADPLAFIENNALVVSWPITQVIAQHAAERNPERILREVEKAEAEHEHHKIHGKTYRGTRKNPAWHVDAERYVESEEEPYNRPCWDLLRRW
jgi:hypothetical protein